MNLIKSLDICRVSSRKGLKGSTLSIGDIVQVIGTRVLPEKRSDPYLQRIYVLVIKFSEDKFLVPNDNNEHKAVLVDPRKLEKVDGETQEYYEEVIKKQYDTSN